EDGRLYARVSGAEPAVAAATQAIGGMALADAPAFWSSVRDQTHAFFASDDSATLWRLSVQSTAPYPALGGHQAIEWGGALRWLKVRDASFERLRAWAREHGGHATFYRGDKSASAFQPLNAPTLAIHRGLKATFDPSGIFNRRRMFADF